MNEKGFTVIEGLVAMSILGFTLTAVLSTFVGFKDVTTRNGHRSGAMAAAQQIVESTRQADPAAMPSSGKSSPDIVEIDGREFEVVSYFCKVSEYCGENSRHITIVVNYGGRTLYKTESVFTKLQ